MTSLQPSPDHADIMDITAACNRSRARHRLRDENDVREVMAASDVVHSYDDASRRIVDLVRLKDSAFDTHYLREVALALQMNAAIREELPENAEAVMRVVSGLCAGDTVKPLSDPAWEEAITWARVAAIGQAYLHRDDRHDAVVEAAKRLRQRGYDVPDAPKTRPR